MIYKWYEWDWKFCNTKCIQFSNKSCVRGFFENAIKMLIFRLDNNFLSLHFRKNSEINFKFLILLIFKWRKMFHIIFYCIDNLFTCYRKLFNVVCYLKNFLTFFISMKIERSKDWILDQLYCIELREKWRNLSKIYANKCEMRVFVDALEKVSYSLRACLSSDDLQIILVYSK